MSSWVLRSTGLPSTLGLARVLYSGGTWVVTAGLGAIITSRDGVNWTIRRQPSDTFSLSSLTTNGYGTWVGGGLTYSRPDGPDYPETLVVSVDDGMTWTQIDTSAFAGQVWGLAYGNGRFVMSGRTFPDGTTEVPQLATSVDGLNWTAQTAPFPIFGIEYGGGKFLTNYDPLYGTVGLGIDSRMAYSSDGVNWTVPSSRVFKNPDETWASFAYGNGMWLGYSASTSRVATSGDGINWTIRNRISQNSPLQPIGRPRYYDGKWRIPGKNNSFPLSADVPIFVSADDGRSWTVETAKQTIPTGWGAYPAWTDLFGAAGRWVAIGSPPNLATLEDELLPLNITIDSQESWHNIGTTPGRLKLYGPGGWFEEVRDGDPVGRDRHTLRVWDGTAWRDCIRMQLPPL